MKYKIYLGALLLALCGSACFEDPDTTFDELTLVEFEDAVRTTPAPGATFPIVALTRTSGTRTAWVNLIGKHLGASQNMRISIDTAVTPFLRSTDIRAEAGKHFDLSDGSFAFKADTSFAPVRFKVLDPGATVGKFAFFILRLDGNDEIKPSENYRRIGYRIDLK